MPQPLPHAEDEPRTLPVTDLLCFATYAANNAFGRAYGPILGKLGLTYPQYLVMVVLWEQDEQTVSAIGQRLFLESNTLTPLLKRLQAMGLLTRTRATHDERQVVVRLTEAGRLLQRDGQTVPACMADLLGLEMKTLARIREDLALLRERLAGSEG